MMKWLMAAVASMAGCGPTITGQQARELVAQGALLVDVRTPAEYAQGHLQGARNIPVAEVEARLAELGADKSKPIVLYCRSGMRSGKAQQLLRSRGFTNVHNLGGMSNW